MQTTLFSGTTPLLIFVAKATLLLVAALVGTITLRRSTAGARHLVWLAALVGVLALPLLSRIPALQLGVLPSALAPSATVETAYPVTPAPRARLAPSEQSAPAPGEIAPPAPAPQAMTAGVTPGGSNLDTSVANPSPVASASILQTLAIVWAGIALSLLAWLGAGALQVRRIVRGARELTSPDWTMPLCEVADRLDLEQPPRLVISDRIEMAFACRALSPTVVLPAAAESWTDDRRRAVLFHELAHVKRHDLVGHTLGRIACALYWFHPLVWTAAKHLRSESERACDDLVLSCGARPSEYAQHLLDMVTSVRNHGAPIMALPMARRKEFEGRMLAILDPAIRRASPGPLQSAIVVMSLGVLSLTVAAVSPAAARPAVAAAVVDGANSHTRDADTVPAPAPAPSPSAAPSPSVALAAADADARSEVRQQADAAVEARAEAHAQGRAGVEAFTSPAFTDAITRVATQVTRETLKSLGGTQASARRQASDTGRIALLIRVLETDSDAGVRRSAAWALNEVNTPGTRYALVRALRADTAWRVRETAAWALSDYSTDETSSALATALLTDRSAEVRRTAAWALGQGGRRRDSDALVSAISDSDPNVRHLAIWSLGQLGLTRAPMSLINAINDDSQRVREIAAWSLGQIGDSAAVRPISRAFETEPERNVKRAQLWALLQIGVAPPSVVESAMKSADPEIRKHGVAMLSGSGAWPWPWPWPWPRPSP